MQQTDYISNGIEVILEIGNSHGSSGATVIKFLKQMVALIDGQIDSSMVILYQELLVL